jgi:hypothetical protein
LYLCCCNDHFLTPQLDCKFLKTWICRTPKRAASTYFLSK